MRPKRVTLFAGHYGSGKSNIAVNYALKLEGEGYPVRLESIGEEHCTTFDLAEGDSMAQVLRITDNYGQTIYAFLGGHLRKNGWVQHSDLNSDFPWQPGVEVYK